MKEEEIRQAPIFSMKNSDRIAESKQCGCYYCLKTCGVEEITEWTDQNQTAICPHCNVDSLIPDQTGVELTEENLQKLHKYWFNPTPDNYAQISAKRGSASS